MTYYHRDRCSLSFLRSSTFEDPDAVFTAESGTLTIDASTEERTSGTFSFLARTALIEDGTQRSVTVSGTFDARSFGNPSDDPGRYTPLFP